MGYHTERMADIGNGVAPRRRRQLMEDPRFFLSCLPAPGVVCVMETRTTACSLRISAEGAALAGVHGESGYWGPCGFRPLFPCASSLFGDSSVFVSLFV